MQQIDSPTIAKRVVRMGLSLLFAPPRVDLRAFLAAGIRPLFERNEKS